MTECKVTIQAKIPCSHDINVATEDEALREIVRILRDSPKESAQFRLPEYTLDYFYNGAEGNQHETCIIVRAESAEKFEFIAERLNQLLIEANNNGNQLRESTG
jgi:hypothetical protein